MATSQGQDLKVLQELTYADSTHLDVRYRTHQLYTVNPVSFGQWLQDVVHGGFLAPQFYELGLLDGVGGIGEFELWGIWQVSGDCWQGG